MSRTITLDEESELILRQVAESFDGDETLALREVLRTHGAMESLMDEIEADQQDPLRAQKDRAEADIAAGRLVPWNEVKRVSGL